MKNSKRRKHWLFLIVFITSLVGYQLTASDQTPSSPLTRIDEMVFDLKYLNREPIQISQESPRYPAKLREAGIEGEAVLVFVVDKKGAVGKFLEIRATHEEFAASAAEAVKQWKFTPGKINGFPVNCAVRMTVPFRIE